MNLLLTATPLAMGAHGHAYHAVATVISAHVIGMFAPSFVTGDLIRRFGALCIILRGVALNLLCIAIALAGVAVADYWLDLVMLGIGWNFLYIGGTALLTDAYRPAETAKDALIFIATATSSFSSGVIIENNGSQMLNYAAIQFVVSIGGAVVWLAMHRKRNVAMT